MGVERLVPPNSAEQRRSRLERIFFREREKDLLVSKYRDQCNSRGFRKRREAEVSSAASGQNEGSLLIQGAGMEVQTSAQCNEPICARAETVATPPDDDAISCYSVSAYTTSTPQERRNLLMARLPTPVIGKPGSGSFSARTPRSASSRGGEPERPPSLGDAAYASAATPAPEVLDAIAEAKSVPGPVPEESEASEVDDRQSASLEWSVLDKIAAELHKQDNLRAKQREWELKQKLRQDLDRQMADERLKQERAKVEEQHYLQMQEEHTKLWYLEMEQRAAERQQKIEATQKDRDSQLALLRAKRAEEKAQEKQERQELMDSLHRDIVKDKLDAEERLKARREQVQKAFRETAEATKQRKAQAELLALQEQQQVEAYERLRAERQEQRQHMAEKEAAQRREIEEHAGIRASAMQRLSDDTESKAAAERIAKDRAAEQHEQANRKKLEDMKSQTQEYLLKQMKEKQAKKAVEVEKARQLAKAQAAEVKHMEAQEKERDAFKKKLVYDHHSELKKQIKVRARQKDRQEAMSDCELRLNKQLLEKVSLALTDMSTKTC